MDKVIKIECEREAAASRARVSVCAMENGMRAENMDKLARRVSNLGYTLCNAVVSWPVGGIEEGVVLGEKREDSGPLQGTKRFALWSFGNQGELYWGHYEMGENEAHALFAEEALAHCRAQSRKIGKPVDA